MKTDSGTTRVCVGENTSLPHIFSPVKAALIYEQLDAVDQRAKMEVHLLTLRVNWHGLPLPDTTYAR